MSLVNEQSEFLLDVAKLILKASEMGLVVTGGELHRPLEMQQIYMKTGRSKTMNSMHLKRCAIDLNFFKDGKLTYDIGLLKPLGTFWESLNPRNRWGGNWKSFKDVPHFERNV
jgi:hypothetical protein